MMIFSNGVLRDATKEEIEMFEAMEKSAQSYYQQLTKDPTAEERIVALEQSISSLKSSFSKFEAKLKYLNL